MDRQKENWNQYYSIYQKNIPDRWLEKYRSIFEKGGEVSVLDLGCGGGANIPFLLEQKVNISACDYADAAVEIVKTEYNIDCRIADVRNALPYQDAQFDIVISDLSLHYFSGKETFGILKRISRVLKRDGIFLIRVNAVGDIKHGFGKGEEVEKNYFFFEGRRKRFFDKEAICQYFKQDFIIDSMTENISLKYREEKVLWEIFARKKSIY